jgi:hypothetical protein
VQKLCTHGILLKNGTLYKEGRMSAVIDSYLENNVKDAIIELPGKDNIEASLIRVEIRDDQNVPVSEIPIGRKWKVVLRYKVNEATRGFVTGVGIVNAQEVPLKTTWAPPVDVTPGEYEAVFEENVISYSVGQYKVCIGLSQGTRPIEYFDNLISFNIIPVVDEVSSSVLVFDNSTGMILNPMDTSTRKII